MPFLFGLILLPEKNIPGLLIFFQDEVKCHTSVFENSGIEKGYYMYMNILCGRIEYRIS